MRRPIRLAILLALVLLVAAGASFLVATRVSPERLRAAAENALTEALRHPVQVAGARLRLGWSLPAPGVRVELFDVTAEAEAPWQSALHLEQVRAQLDPLLLLLGEPHVRAIHVEGGTLWLEPAEPGSLRPSPAPKDPSQAPTDPLAEPLRVVDDMLQNLIQPEFPVRSVRFKNSRVVFADPSLRAHAAAVELVNLHGRLALGGPSALPTLSLRGEVSSGASSSPFKLRARRVSPQQLTLRGELEVAGATATLLGKVETPVAADPELQVDARLDALDFRRAHSTVAMLPEPVKSSLQAVTGPVVSGQLRELEISGAARASAWRRVIEGKAGLLPRGVEAQADLHSLKVQFGEVPVLERLSGRVFASGDRVSLRGLRAMRDGSTLPLLDLTVNGVTNLASNPKHTRELPDVAPLYGLAPFYDLVSGGKREDSGNELLLELDRLEHPALFWPLRHLFGHVRVASDGVRAKIEHAVWGQVPIQAEGVWSRNGVERVSVAMTAHAPLDVVADAEATPTPADAGWATGRWHLDAHMLGKWRVESSTGIFRAVGQTVTLPSMVLNLGASGTASGDGVLDFSSRDDVPYQTNLRLVGGDASHLGRLIRLKPEEAEGSVDMEGRLAGRLRRGRSIFDTLHGSLWVEAKEGQIARPLPVALAVAKATETLNPFTRRDAFRFSEIQARLRFDYGQLSVEELDVNGPDLRLVASGEIDLSAEDHPVSGVVGIFFFRALDRLVGSVPIVNWILLGPDDNLVGAYVSLEGPWENPDASLIPTKTMASGPASFAFEAVPRFVNGAARGVRWFFNQMRPTQHDALQAPRPTPPEPTQPDAGL